MAGTEMRSAFREDPPDADGTRWRPGDTHRIRARILGGFLLLLVGTAAVATLVVGEVLRARLESRVQGALSQEVSEFNRLLVLGNDPDTGENFASLSAAFDLFLERNVPSNEEAFVTFLDGQQYRSVVSRFPLDRLPQVVVDRFESADALPDDPEGRFETDVGTGYYRALPARVGTQDGTFVVLILPTAEFGQIQELQVYGALAVLAVLALASLVAWALVNRLLGPVLELTETAQRISRSDLAGRIAVRGSGEAADMARTFNAMLDRLQAVFHTEREFVRDASHELRVPLTVCMGNLDVLAVGLPESEKENLQVIGLVTDEIGRMARIVDDLRLLADAAQPDFLAPERIDVDALLADLLAKSRRLGDREWHLDAAPGGEIDADRHRITEAVLNLTENAVQHTRAGDAIAIGAAIEGPDLRIWVRDTGVGVPAGDQARIFNRFRRGARAYRTYRGSGLGLSIVRAVTEAHGGRVRVESVEGEGSTFTMLIPFVRKSSPQP
ncbi:HAMP domain-containing sensor histidine kinase [Pseudonocardia sp.]|uniref:sensor histidine kinase n=1 Tax=Pseudonocardia sp. TaxID=60912 RepID=UPI00261C821E|nr:HAMP domain-containing sensor histidine kinase [Pseudonocardia sp.]